MLSDNDPELNGKYLGTITQDFVQIAEMMKEASYQIRKRGFEYPIFPISKVEIPIGTLLLEKSDLHTEWNYYASYIDEFLQRKIVDDKEKFTEAYKDPDEFCCLFVVDEDFTNFLFIPYPED